MNHRAIKVSIIGTHGSGKTTLSGQLTSQLRALGIKVAEVAEVPRAVCVRLDDPTYFHRGKNTVVRQMALLLMQIVAESERNQAVGQVLLTDRSVLDHWAYTVCQFRDVLRAENIEPLLEDTVIRYSATYDLLLYLPPEIPLVADGVREDDIAFRNEVDQTLMQILTRYALPFKRVAGAIGDRTATALAAVLRCMPQS